MIRCPAAGGVSKPSLRILSWSSSSTSECDGPVMMMIFRSNYIYSVKLAPLAAPLKSYPTSYLTALPTSSTPSPPPIAQAFALDNYGSPQGIWSKEYQLTVIDFRVCTLRPPRDTSLGSIHPCQDRVTDRELSSRRYPITHSLPVRHRLTTCPHTGCQP